MRWSLGSVLACACAGALASSPVAADSGLPAAQEPAFLGIGYDFRSFPVLITSVEPDSAASEAGLAAGDEVIRIEQQPANGQNFRALITSFHSGDPVHLDVMRSGRPASITAILSTRSEILQRRFVGHAAPTTQLVDVDDHAAYDLAALHGRTAIVAWKTTSCMGCNSLIHKVQDWANAGAARRHGQAPLTMAVVSGTAEDAVTLGASHPEIPTAVVPIAEFAHFAISDNADENRVTFMVVDRHGNIVFVNPISADDDGADAAIDDVIAACAHAERRSR